MTDNTSTPGSADSADDAINESEKNDPYTDGSVPADADLASDDEETKGAPPSL
jgi:hypothetical protein